MGGGLSCCEEDGAPQVVAVAQVGYSTASPQLTSQEGANMDEPRPAVDALCGRQASRNLIVFGMMAFLPRSESDVETLSQKTTSFQATSFWADGHVP